MSYSESDNQVVLTMSREDYRMVMLLLKLIVYDAPAAAAISSETVFAMLNRLNSGNPNYTPPYQTGESK